MSLLSLSDNFVRMISDAAGLWQFHLMRSGMALPLLVLGAFFLRLPLAPRRPGPVFVRSGVQTLSMLLYFGALAAAPIAQVAAALFTAPLWVLVFGAAFFGRPIGSRRLLAVTLGFAGALVMLRPDPDNLSAMTLMPVAAGAFYGLSNLLTREWCGEEPVGALLVTFFGGLAIAGAVALAVLETVEAPRLWVEAAPFLTAPWRNPSAATTGWIFAQSALALVGVGLIARGYQAGDTSALAVFEYGFLPMASFWAWTLWGETLQPVDFLGMAMIVAAGAVVALSPSPPPREPVIARGSRGD
jgi:drug/metabolite transporter (DMT)-like permease